MYSPSSVAQRRLPERASARRRRRGDDARRRPTPRETRGLGPWCGAMDAVERSLRSSTVEALRVHLLLRVRALRADLRALRAASRAVRFVAAAGAGGLGRTSRGRGGRLVRERRDRACPELPRRRQLRLGQTRLRGGLRERASGRRRRRAHVQGRDTCGDGPAGRARTRRGGLRAEPRRRPPRAARARSTAAEAYAPRHR